jgi:glycerol-3-phosphate acyltransferase PlsY
VPTVIQWITAAGLGYIIGSIPFSYLIARFVGGVDLRESGTQNVGGSNVAAATSKKWGVVAGILDFSKGYVSPLFVSKILGLPVEFQITAGFFSIVGHMWPMFLRFQGGRGMASGVGVALFFAPVQGLICLGLVIFFMIAKEVGLGSIIAFTCLPILTAVFGEPFWITGICLGLLMLLLFRRLWFLKGDIASGESFRSVFLNRLLYDSRERRRAPSS